MNEIKGDIVKRFMMRGKFVVIARIDTKGSSIYTFKVTDKCNNKDYFSNDRYYTFEDCEKASVKICKTV